MTEYCHFSDYQTPQCILPVSGIKNVLCGPTQMTYPPCHSGRQVILIQYSLYIPSEEGFLPPFSCTPQVVTLDFLHIIVLLPDRHRQLYVTIKSTLSHGIIYNKQSVPVNGLCIS